MNKVYVHNPVREQVRGSVSIPGWFRINRGLKRYIDDHIENVVAVPVWEIMRKLYE